MNDTPPAGERVQKLLAAAGIASRRAIEDWIRDGRISINGRIAQLGDRALPGDQVCVDGRRVALSPALVADGAAGGAGALLIYNKPVGEMTTRRDPQGRPTVFERLPAAPTGRWVVVGRLDVNTAGLLLFTNDGALAHRLMHPSSEIEREYLVRVRGEPGAEDLAQLRRGVHLDDGWARFDAVTATGASEGHSWFRVVLHEGRNREVRRLWNEIGYDVSRLTRIRYGNIELPRDLRPGASRFATATEMARLAELAAAPGTVK
jgi:23S rRNA pseudouridine2605 synthase